MVVVVFSLRACVFGVEREKSIGRVSRECDSCQHSQTEQQQRGSREKSRGMYRELVEKRTYLEFDEFDKN